MEPLTVIATVLVVLAAAAAFRRARRVRYHYLAMACGPGGHGGAWEDDGYRGHGGRHHGWGGGAWSGGGGRWAGGWGRSPRGAFRFIASYLALTDAQARQLRELLGDLKGGLADAKDIAKKARRGVSDALRSDVFDESQVAEAADACEQAVDKARERLIAALSRLHAVLDPSQRERLADLIDRGPRAFWRRGPDYV